MSKVYIGIDPGKSGGIASVIDNAAIGMPMPQTERCVYQVIKNLVGKDRAVAVIEKVHSMPKQGVVSSFTFGQGYGFLRGCLIALGIPFREVSPQAWQKYLEIPRRSKDETKTQFKRRLLSVAQQMFPDVNATLKTADALLIAEYCRRCDG